jgi:transcriptional regulator of acetoin/glycerol metabolism
MVSETRKLSAESIADPKSFESKVSEAIRRSRGNVTEAAEILGISRRTMCRYIAENPALARVVEKVRGKT